jgi:hypothetical protein
MDSQPLVVAHTAISVVAILSGVVAVFGMLAKDKLSAMTALFLVTTGATCITGYFFQRDQILPSQVVGGIVLAILALTCLALYTFRLQGAWRTVFVFGMVTMLWLNVFVLVAQAFLKIAPLHALAPKGSEAVVFAAFLTLAFKVRARFHPATTQSSG